MSRRKKSTLDDTQPIEVERLEVEEKATTVLGQDGQRSQRSGEPDPRGLEHITKETDTASIMRAVEARKVATGQQEAVPRTQFRKEGAMDSSSKMESGSDSGTTTSVTRSPRSARLSADERAQRLYEALSPEQQAELNDARRRVTRLLERSPQFQKDEVKSLARQLVIDTHALGLSLNQTLELVTSVWKVNSLEWSVERSRLDTKSRNDDIGSLLG